MARELRFQCFKKLLYKDEQLLRVLFLASFLGEGSPILFSGIKGSHWGNTYSFSRFYRIACMKRFSLYPKGHVGPLAHFYSEKMCSQTYSAVPIATRFATR
jgi:hypothetical protein